MTSLFWNWVAVFLVCLGVVGGGLYQQSRILQGQANNSTSQENQKEILNKITVVADHLDISVEGKTPEEQLDEIGNAIEKLKASTYKDIVDRALIIQQDVSQKNEIAYPFIKTFFDQLEKYLSDLEKNPVFEVRTKSRDLSNQVYGKSMTYYGMIGIDKCYANFHPIHVNYKGKSYPGIRITTIKNGERSNTASLVFDTENEKVFKKLDEYGNYEKFSDQLEYELSNKAVKVIVGDLIQYLTP